MSECRLNVRMMEKPNQRTLQVSFYLVELKIVYVIVHEGTEHEIDKKKKEKNEKKNKTSHIHQNI